MPYKTIPSRTGVSKAAGHSASIRSGADPAENLPAALRSNVQNNRQPIDPQGQNNADIPQGCWVANPDLPAPMRWEIERLLENARCDDLAEHRVPEHLWWGGLLEDWYRRGRVLHRSLKSSGGAMADPPDPPSNQSSRINTPSELKDQPKGDKDQPMPPILAKGTADTQDVALVRAELEKMPAKYRQKMVDNGTKVIVVRGSVTEYRTDLKGVTPRRWKPSYSWDTVPGLQSGNEVVIATRGHGTSGGPYVPHTGDGHGSYNLVFHEAAHSLDINSNSSTEAFKDARSADLSSLSRYEKQAGNAGLEETYAESFANVFGGNKNYSSTHPNLDAYWKGMP